MDNAAIADNFSLLSKLMDIHGENAFKSRSYSAAAFNIDKLPERLADLDPGQLSGVRGIGESVARKISEMLETGRLEILEEYLQKTPPGVIEMLNIKGLGPKKINSIWKEMGIESIGELLYACNENRLTRFKGFGEKTQQNVLEAIHFYQQNQGSFLFAEVEALFPQIDAYLKKTFSPATVHVTGAFRRQDTTIDELEFVVLENNQLIKPRFQTAQPPELLEETATSLLYKLKNGLKLRLYTNGSNRALELFRTTGSAEFTEALLARFSALNCTGEETSDDAILFSLAGIPFIPPPLRHSAAWIERARLTGVPELIRPEDIRAIIHSHSQWSDGAASLESMAAACISRGFEYLVISDHSKAAAYANGLSEERIAEQHREIDQLNQRYKPFRIFKSIECDILNDGSLDYRDEVLARFDLVIASVHSNLKMTEEKAMARLLKAIENPYTTILGHPSGRLLLSRPGYPLDYRKIIDACAANQVVIELNAHPRRLDIDWSWIGYALDKGVLLSIDPDAHYLEGYEDVRYGVLAAQKGGLTRASNLSSFSLPSFENFLRERRRLRIAEKI